jgi:hypothetical protein
MSGFGFPRREICRAWTAKNVGANHEKRQDKARKTARNVGIDREICQDAGIIPSIQNNHETCQDRWQLMMQEANF